MANWERWRGVELYGSEVTRWEKCQASDVAGWER